MANGQRRGGGARKERTWARVGFGPTGVVVGTNQMFDMLVDYSEAIGRTPGDITIARIIGRLSVNRTVQTGDTTGGRLAAGIIVVSQQAFDIGITAMPDPDDAALAADWLWIDEVPIPGAPAEATSFYAAPFDVRGMRRMQGYNKKLVLLVNNAMANPVGAVDFWLSVRILILGEP